MCPGCGGGSSTDVASGEVSAAPLAAAPAGNSAPTIDGDANKVVQVGSDYTFQPVSHDADGDTLTFSATNLPPWATLDPHSGQIHGTPSASDVGAYEGISITVADASHHVSSRDFSITVIGTTSGVALLEWPAPVSKVDGSVLDDLAGYRIMYGHDPEDLDHSVYIPDPDAHSFEFATLDAGTWYFSIVAVNAGGLEGPATAPARKII
jgi:catechol 2,3-dioxygenase-like lactoylglutathione lyase family enzyme